MTNRDTALSTIGNSSFNLVSMTLMADNSFITELKVEHSWHSSIVDILNIYDLQESEIINQDDVKDILVANFEEFDYSIQNGQLLLRNDYSVIDSYVNLLDNYIMDYLEYYDFKY